MDLVIRAARTDEVALLNDVERDGDRRYVGYDGIPAGFDDVVAVPTLTAAQDEGRLWVALSGAESDADTDAELPDEGHIIGFTLAEVVDGNAHLGQLSVRLGFQGRGVGRRLIDTVSHWARQRSMTALTLCTFSDVAWNQPFYERVGFVVLPEAQWMAGLRAVFEDDAALGLDLSRRVVMRLALPDG